MRVRDSAGDGYRLQDAHAPQSDTHDSQEWALVKKYDPLWEYAGVKQALVGGEPDVDARCPVCHVTVHLGLEAEPGRHVECGLCGAELEIAQESGAPVLRPLD